MTKVLIVEDNALNLRLFSEVLRCEGLSVATATNGTDALSTAQTERPDVILLDIQMPGLSGFEVLDRLRRDDHLARVPVIAVTAFAARGDQRRVNAHGFDGYLAKPIVGDALIDAVRAVLAGGRAASAPPATPAV